jgi:hypothetical protein
MPIIKMKKEKISTYFLGAIKPPQKRNEITQVF